jgi:RNA-directed DNA polymerase
VYVIEWAGDYQPPGASTSEMVHGQGTAFAFRNSTSLITCDHVLRWYGDIKGVKVETDIHDPAVNLAYIKIINPASGLDLPVTVAARDRSRDLALLITNGATLPRHFSGMESPLNRNERAVLCGYPNWSPGRTSNHADTAVMSRYQRSGLSRFEISANIRQGYSGGPLIDLQYRVAGVAQQGATQQDGNDECLCVSEVDKWVNGLL